MALTDERIMLMKDDPGLNLVIKTDGKRATKANENITPKATSGRRTRYDFMLCFISTPENVGELYFNHFVVSFCLSCL